MYGVTAATSIGCIKSVGAPLMYVMIAMQSQARQLVHWTRCPADVKNSSLSGDRTGYISVDKGDATEQVQTMDRERVGNEGA